MSIAQYGLERPTALGGEDRHLRCLSRDCEEIVSDQLIKEKSNRSTPAGYSLAQSMINWGVGWGWVDGEILTRSVSAAPGDFSMWPVLV